MDKFHGVFPFLLSLIVEELRQPGERFSVKKGGDLDILMRGSQFMPDLGTHQVCHGFAYLHSYLQKWSVLL
jgi:hypothetical protein